MKTKFVVPVALAKGGDESPEARRKRNAKPHNRAARREYMKTPDGRRAASQAKDRYETRHPERAKAQDRARTEHGPSEGTGHKCAVCGKPAKHKHHVNYTKDGGGTVRWLCHPHHVKAHHPKSNITDGVAKAEADMSDASNDAKHKDQIPGGRADKKKPSDFDPKQLAEGTKHELEHTEDRHMAMEIAMDHLAEDPKYYVKLKRVERVEKSAEASSTAAPPKAAALRKGLYDYGKDWFDQYRDTPFFADAIKLEQAHMAHEAERKQREAAARAAREAARRARDAEEAKSDSVYDWDRRWYASHDAKIVELRSKYLDWLANHPNGENGENGEEVEKSASASASAASASGHPDPHMSPPKEHRQAGAKNRSDYADPDAYRYPIHDEKHVRAAISYFNMPRNYGKYSSAKRAEVWSRIKAAAKKFGIEVSDPGTPGKEGKAMSKSQSQSARPAVFDEIMKGGLGMPAGIGTQRGGSAKMDDEVEETDEETEKALAATQAALHASLANLSPEQQMAALKKALSTLEQGEAGMAAAGTLGANRNIAAGAASGGDAEPFASEAMNGMPSASAGQSVVLSEDDADVGSQMSDGKKPLEQSVGGGGSAALQASANQVMGGDVSGGAGMTKSISSAGALGSEATAENNRLLAQREAQLRKGAEDVTYGFGIAPPARNPEEPTRARQWAQGHVFYSEAEDAHIARQMQKSVDDGHGGLNIAAEPTINRQMPLTKSMTCRLCKSRVPAMFSTCPACGGDHATGHRPVQSEQHAMYLSKAVRDSLVGPQDEDVVFAGGLISDE